MRALIVLCALVVTCSGVEQLGRFVFPSIFSARYWIGGGSGVLAYAFASRFAVTLKWTHFLAATLLLSVAAIGGFLGHYRFGSPISSCEFSAVEVDVCWGREWSFMQSFMSFEYAEGRIQKESSRRFIEGILKTPQSPYQDDGLFLDCPFERPEVWERVRCEAVGMSNRDQCYWCQGVDGTGTSQFSVYGFDKNLSEATVFRSDSIHPRAAPVCVGAIDPTLCWKEGEPPAVNRPPKWKDRRK